MSLVIETKGSSLALSLYEISVDNLKEIEKKLISDAYMWIPGETEQGFCHAHIADDALVAKFKVVSCFWVEVEQNGENVEKEFERIDECTMILFNDMLCVQGKNSAQSQMLYMLSAILDITIEPRKFSKEEMKNAENHALEIKNIKFEELPHTEIQKLAMSGKMEDVSNIGGMSFNESKIKNFTGRFDSPDGNCSIKLTDGGRLTIWKIKGRDVSVTNLKYFIDLFCKEV